MLQLCADFYKNCAIDDTNLKFCEVLENIISQIFGYRDISYSVFNKIPNLKSKNCTFSIVHSLLTMPCPEMSMELPVMACQLYSQSYNEIHITINDIHNLNDIHG